MGCGVRSNWNAFDGSYPGLIQPDSGTIMPGNDYSYLQHCVAVHGTTNIERTIGNKQCCKSPSYEFNCVLRYSDESTGSNPSQASVSCNTGYVMTGCSGWGLYNTLNGHWINNNICWARSYSTYSVYAIAICCKLGTDSPTPAPSDQPTDPPTIEPTLEPTTSPSFSPSAAPVHPTKSPTFPTNSPTDDPSFEPTASPSFSPSAAPVYPTISPTVEPSLEPTPAPSSQVTDYVVCILIHVFLRNCNILKVFMFLS